MEEAAPTYPGLLIGGIVLVAIYAVVVDILGFLLSTFLFLAAFMYLGRYRTARCGVEHQRDCHRAGGVDFHALRVCLATARRAAIRRIHRFRPRSCWADESRERAMSRHPVAACPWLR